MGLGLRDIPWLSDQHETEKLLISNLRGTIFFQPTSQKKDFFSEPYINLVFSARPGAKSIHSVFSDSEMSMKVSGVWVNEA
jgi:hypothetical protein